MQPTALLKDKDLCVSISITRRFAHSVCVHAYAIKVLSLLSCIRYETRLNHLMSIVLIVKFDHATYTLCVSRHCNCLNVKKLLKTPQNRHGICQLSDSIMTRIHNYLIGSLPKWLSGLLENKPNISRYKNTN